MSLDQHWQKITLNPRIWLYTRRMLKELPYDSESVRSIQLAKLKRLLIYAYEHFEFYRDRFDQAEFNPNKFRHLEQLQQLPLLTKQEYREYTQEIYQKDPNNYIGGYCDGTSGSTGVPLKIFRTWDERAYMSAKYMRTLFFNGYRWNDITFSLPSPHRLQRDSFLQHLGVMQRHSLAYTEPAERMVEEYIKVQPTVLYANKSQLVQMALLVDREGIQINRPRMYVCAAETLDINSRNIITRVFGKENLFEVYGAVEFNNLAWQKAGSDCFHFSHTTNYLELHENGVVRKNAGYCAISDLHIYSFPLIRYNLGDWLDTEIRDGVQVIRRIRGREDDWVILDDGTHIPFHLFYEIMEKQKEILQFRVIQETHRLIRIQVVKAASASHNDLEAILQRDLRNEMHADGIEFKIEWIEEIPPDANGKLRMLISKVKGI